MRPALPITVASYNMRKAVGLDGRRDPQRVLKVLTEIDADIVALQEADKRVGTRGAAVPHAIMGERGFVGLVPVPGADLRALLLFDEFSFQGVLDPTRGWIREFDLRSSSRRQSTVKRKFFRYRNR